MADRTATYPNISRILAQKAAGRRRQADLSFAEKLVILDAMKERVAPIAQARESRRRQQQRLLLDRD